jgi:hypothetical protein
MSLKTNTPLLVSNELVDFQLIQTPCCGHSLCWLNPRLPTHCPECGTHILLALKTGAHHALRANAWLRLEEKRK